MALIATIGQSDSNCYVTQAEANAYFVDRMHSSDWEDFEDPDPVLITSSQMLDWYMNWKGTKTSADQFMGWPREDAIRKDGTEIEDDVIPNEVKIAVYELAISSLEADRLGDNPLAGIEQLKVGSLAIKASIGGVDSTVKNAVPEKVRKILSDLYTLGGGMSVVRLMRA